MKINNKNTKVIELTFDLTSYLIDHPQLLTKYQNNDNFVIFVKDNKMINAQSETILTDILGRGLDAIRATKTSSTQNRWNFEIVNSALQVSL